MKSFGESLFELWSPPYSVWTPWAKPVLFAQLQAPAQDSRTDDEWETLDVSWAPPATERVALIIDLPGEVPLLTGLKLAHRGYQPVVLYNCCNGPRPVLDLDESLKTLCSAEHVLRELLLPPNAPPAFLIDFKRDDGKYHTMPGTFDNRWFVLPQDFPSADFLLANRISRVDVIHSFNGQPKGDLAHVLLRWQNAGIRIRVGYVGAAPVDMRIQRPRWYRYAIYSALAYFGFRTNSAGGFGSMVPIPSENSGFG